MTSVTVTVQWLGSGLDLGRRSVATAAAAAESRQRSRSRVVCRLERVPRERGRRKGKRCKVVAHCYSAPRCTAYLYSGRWAPAGTACAPCTDARPGTRTGHRTYDTYVCVCVCITPLYSTGSMVSTFLLMERNRDELAVTVTRDTSTHEHEHQSTSPLCFPPSASAHSLEAGLRLLH